MFILHETFWWLIGTGLVGFVLGAFRGVPRWGLLLGLLLGPLGWAALFLIPARARFGAFTGARPAGGPFRANQRPGAFGPGSFGPNASGPFSGPALGPACPRCGHAVGRSDKTCSQCGNVLIPIRYRVGADPASS